MKVARYLFIVILFTNASIFAIDGADNEESKPPVITQITKTEAVEKAPNPPTNSIYKIISTLGILAMSYVATDFLEKNFKNLKLEAYGFAVDEIKYWVYPAGIVAGLLVIDPENKLNWQLKAFTLIMTYFTHSKPFKNLVGPLSLGELLGHPIAIPIKGMGFWYLGENYIFQKQQEPSPAQATQENKNS